MEGPESGISTKSVVLNNWISRVVFALVLKIFFLISVSDLVRWLLVMSVLGFSLGIGVSSSLVKSPESSISSESVVLNNWIRWIVFALVLEIFFLISVGDLIRWLLVMSMVMFLLSM